MGNKEFFCEKIHVGLIIWKFTYGEHTNSRQHYRKKNQILEIL